MTARARNGVLSLALIAALATAACVPDPAPGPGPGSGANQTTTIVYNGPRGNCDTEKVLVGARVRPCQGLANETTKVIVTSKVLDATCVDFYGYYPVTKVLGTARQGASPATPLTQTDTTPGTPVFDTGYDIDDGPITVTITNLTVDTANLVCGWFGKAA